MDTRLLERVKCCAPQWLRYLLALSEIARAGTGWVVASGDEVALFDAEGRTIMPLWPSAELAAEMPVDGGLPTPVPVAELTGRLLPSLGEDALVAVFPAGGDNTLVAPADVARDIEGFSADPRDIAAEILAEPVAAPLSELAMIEAPDMSAFAPPEGGEAALVVLLGEEGGVIGLVAEEGPALLLFADEAHALAFRARTEAPAEPVALSADALVNGWLLLAFSAGWGIATLDDPAVASVMTPARCALEFTERWRA